MESFANAVAAESGAPLNIIQMLIAFIMTLLSSCPVPPTPAEIKNGSFRWTTAVYRGMINVGISLRGAQSRAIMAAMQKHAGLATDADISDFLVQSGVTVEPPVMPLKK
jgi:hypothetical protein